MTPNTSGNKTRHQWRKQVRADKQLTAGQRLILTALDEYRNSGRNDAYPSQQVLAEECATNRETVNRALKKAEELGYIVKRGTTRKKDGTQGSVIWGFAFPENQSDRTVTPEEASRVTKNSNQSDHTVTGGVIVRSHKPLNEPLNEPLKSREQSAFDELMAYENQFN